MKREGTRLMTSSRLVRLRLERRREWKFSPVFSDTLLPNLHKVGEDWSCPFVTRCWVRRSDVKIDQPRKDFKVKRKKRVKKKGSGRIDDGRRKKRPKRGPPIIDQFNVYTHSSAGAACTQPPSSHLGARHQYWPCNALIAPRKSCCASGLSWMINELGHYRVSLFLIPTSVAVVPCEPRAARRLCISSTIFMLDASLYNRQRVEALNPSTFDERCDNFFRYSSRFNVTRAHYPPLRPLPRLSYETQLLMVAFRKDLYCTFDK